MEPTLHRYIVTLDAAPGSIHTPICTRVHMIAGNAARSAGSRAQSAFAGSRPIAIIYCRSPTCDFAEAFCYFGTDQRLSSSNQMAWFTSF